MNDVIQWVLVVITGLCFGSFITAASWRLPRGEDLVKAHSKCPKCSYKLRPKNLFPVLSWVLSGAKCSGCRAKISVRYPLTEIVTAAIFAFLFSKFGMSWNFVILAGAAVAILILIIADFETYIIPDSTTIALAILAVVFHVHNGHNFTPFIYGAGICLGLALTLKYGYLYLAKKDGMGMGDVKLFPVLGLWIGFKLLPLLFLFSGVLGILTSIIWKILFKKEEFPFGPSLVIATYFLVLYPDYFMTILQLK